jgi:D-xylose transport system ATP-binding protein
MNVEQRVPLVEMRNIRVAFGGVHAVDDVSVDLFEGEVVGLVGGNGAGKTTLMRSLSGARQIFDFKKEEIFPMKNAFWWD